jgi:YggT family protein
VGCLRTGLAPVNDGNDPHQARGVPKSLEGAFMRAVFEIVLYALELYKFVIIASAIMSWLVAFHVVNLRNEVVRQIWNTLGSLTEPAQKPIRRYLPNTGGIDISPVVVFLLILLVQRIIELYILPYVF